MRMRMLFQRRKAAERLDDELSFHLEQQIAENQAAGMSAEEARFAALRSFGNPALLREEARATWSWNWLEAAVREVRYGFRTLGRTPGFATLAILVMALGIGANVALFTVVHSVLLKPLPYPKPEQLMMVYEHLGDSVQNPVAPGMYTAWKEQNRSFSSLALTGETDLNLAAAGGQLPEKLRGIGCTWNLFPTLGVQPALGRIFTATDDQPSANRTVLLSWSLWKRRFGSDPAIVNRTIQLNSLSYTVIGVMPEWFAFPDAATPLWTPIYRYEPEGSMTGLGDHEYQVIGRLKPGVRAAQGLSDLSAISHHLHDAHLDNPFVGNSASVLPLLDDMVGRTKRPLYVLLAATSCVLLIACLNVANLLVARGAARRKELAIRAALGGGRLRLLRERLMESFLLAAAGGAAGLLLAHGAVRLLVHARPEMSRVEAIHIDGVVAAFTVGLIPLCALFAGLVASLSSKDKQLLTALQDSAHGASTGNAGVRMRRVLLAAEVGLTVVLLIAAGLLLESYARLRASDLGCTTDNTLTMRIAPFGPRYREHAQVVNFYTSLLEGVRALPGVEAAGFTTAVPGQGYWGDHSFEIAEHPPLPQGQAQFAIARSADPGYFAAQKIRILRGHSFDPSRKLDQANQAVINDAFAKQYFPNEDPIGKHLRMNRDYEIVGIVSNTRYSLAEAPAPVQYYPLYSGSSNNGVLVIRAGRNVEQLALPVQRIVQKLDHDLPVSDVLTMDQLLGKSTLDESFNATLLVGFAVLSLLLAAVGLFGVLSYVVAQRTGEIGIRIALGAQREQVLSTVLLDGLRPALFGLALGLAGSVAVVRLIRSMLFQTQPLDPAVFAGVAVTLLLVSAAACLIPAWRASRLDPMQALRTE
jgi:putative ABC transport system permease protein